jgi:hypothetical protein
MANAAVRGLLAVVGLAWALGAQPAAAEENFVTPGSKAAGLKNCVEPTEYMRRNHMELIKHERHIVVHEGIRDSKYSLSGCIACHVAPGPDGKLVSVHAEDQFCDTCHEYAAVDVNCFGCHATVPTTVESATAATGNLGPSMAELPGQKAAVGDNRP